MIIILWLIFSFMIGSLGSKRNIGFWNAFFLSILLSPIIGLIITLISKDKESLEYNKKLLETIQNQQETLDKLTGKVSRNYQTNNYETNYIKEELEKLENLRRTARITEIEYLNLKSNLLNK